MITLQAPHHSEEEAGEWRRLGLSHAGLSRFLHSAQRAAGLRGEVHVLLADDAALQQLNRRFRGQAKPTDVLSFPVAAIVPGPLGVAGDLAISLETATRQAAEFGHSLRDEVRILLLHGVLHLAGFDHDTDRGQMAAREAQLRRALRLPQGLIARAGAPALKKKTEQAKALPPVRRKPRAHA